MEKHNLCFYCPAGSAVRPETIKTGDLISIITAFGSENLTGSRAGLFINSLFLQDLLLERACSQLKKDDLAFFDPFVFAGGIVNSISASVNKKLGLQLYSATYNSSFLFPLLLDFQYASFQQALIVNLVQEDNRQFCAELFLFDKETESELKLTGWSTQKKAPQGTAGFVPGEQVGDKKFCTFRQLKDSCEVLYWEVFK